MRRSYHSKLIAVVRLLFLATASYTVATISPLAARADLVAQYSFDGNAQDSSGFDNHGTVSGAVLTEDRFGNANSAYYFSGNGSHIAAVTNPVLTITNAISIAAWVKVDGTTGDWQVIAGRWYDPTWPSVDNAYVLEINPDGDPSMTLSTGGTTPPIYSVSPQSIFASGWHHIVGTYDGASQNVYVDGVLKNSRPTAGLIWASSAPLWIGSHIVGWDANPFCGTIDDLRIYNHALSESEVGTLAAVPEPCSVLLGAIGLSSAVLAARRRRDMAA